MNDNYSAVLDAKLDLLKSIIIPRFKIEGNYDINNPVYKNIILQSISLLRWSENYFLSSNVSNMIHECSKTLPLKCTLTADLLPHRAIYVHFDRPIHIINDTFGKFLHTIDGIGIRALKVIDNENDKKYPNLHMIELGTKREGEIVLRDLADEEPVSTMSYMGIIVFGRLVINSKTFNIDDNLELSHVIPLWYNSIKIGSTLEDIGYDNTSIVRNITNNIRSDSDALISLAEGVAETTCNEDNIILSLLLFINQKILHSYNCIPGRATRKRIANSSYPDLNSSITVVTLRKFINRKFSSEHEEVEWTCNWIVKGHWRQQWYASSNVHRPIWIFPYIKGDLDKPFKTPSDRLFNVVR